MLKFFRNIRKSLLAHGKTGRYLKYAFGEIILVVIGILIALQINNWNENRILEITRQEYYQQFLEDLNKDKEYIQNTIAKFERQRELYQDYLDKFSESNMTRKTMYHNLLELNMESFALNFNTSTIESLQNSGEIVLIPSVLRNKLIDLKRHQEKIKRDESMDNRGKTGIAERLSMVLGSLSLEERLEYQSELRLSLNIEKNINEIILGLEAIQDWMYFSEKKSISGLKELLVEINDIEKRIQEQVKVNN
jgi:hypothetical protein